MKYMTVYSGNGSYSRESANCLVVALQKTMGISYHKAYKLLASLGRKHGRGFFFTPTIARKFGFKRIPLSSFNKKRTIVLDDVAARFPRGRFLICVRSHIMAYINRHFFENDPHFRQHVEFLYQLPD